jgi:hypothetical protein
MDGYLKNDTIDKARLLTAENNMSDMASDCSKPQTETNFY